MAPPARVWKKLRIEPYDPDAQDGDGDGIVQEGTAWERPAGTRILDASSGAEVTRGSRVGAMRSGAYRIVKKNPQTGKFEDVDYERSYDGRGQALGAATPLSDVGADSLVERGALSIRESTKPPDVIRPEVGVDSEVTGPPVFKRGDPVGKVRDLAESVLEKHGVPRTTDEAFAILRTVFPNLSKNQPSNRELKRGEFDVFVGLLVAAETMPPGWVSDVFGIAFNEQDTLGLEREKSRAEVSRGKFSDVDILGAAGMHINFRSNKISGITEDALTSRAQSDKTVDGGFPTVAQEIYVEARKAGYSHEDALSMLTIAVAVHESAHALHFHKAQKHAGISLDNATDEQIVAAIAAVDGIDADDLLKETLAKYQNNLKRNRRALMQKYPGVFKKRKIEDIAPDSRGMSREQRFALARNLLADRLSEIERKHNWDGLTEEEVRASLSEMSPVSDYGQATVLESVAEAISAQVLDVYDFGDEPPLLMQWLLGGDEDVVRSEVPKGNESIGPSDVPAWEGGDSAGDVVRARNEEIDRQLEEAGATFGTSTVETLGAPEKDDFGRPVGGVPSGMADKAVKDRKAAAEEVKNSALKRFAEIRSVLSGDEGSESESMAEVRKAVSLMSPEVQEFYRDKSPEELLEVLLEEVHGYKEGIAKTQVHLGSNFGEEVSILYGVLDSGRVKNQAESGASKGATSAPELRTQYEMTIGLPADLPPELRPVSGVALHRDVLEEQRRVFRETYGREPTEWDLLPDLGGGDQYGQIRVVLKPEVNERSAIGFDDTLNTVNPVSSMSNDDPEDTLVAFVGQRHPFSNAAGNAETIDRLIEGRVTGTQQKLNIKSTANKVDPELEERRASEVGTSGRSYVEALVPGGVEAEDIEGVEIPYGFFEDRLLPMIESDPELNDWYQKTFLTLDGLVELGLSESEAQEFLNGLTEQQKSLRSSIPEAKGYVRHVVGRRLMDRAKEKGIALKILDDEKIVEETGKFGVDRWDPKTWGKESERELIEARRDLARKRILKSVEDQREASEELQQAGTSSDDWLEGFLRAIDEQGSPPPPIEPVELPSETVAESQETEEIPNPPPTARPYISKSEPPDRVEIDKTIKRFVSGSADHVPKGGSTEVTLDYVLDQIGFLGLPEVVDSIEELPEGQTVFYRGVAGGFGTSSQEMVEQFAHGDCFVGTGNFSGGTYASNFKTTAQMHAGITTGVGIDGQVVAFALRPEAKILSIDDAFAFAKEMQELSPDDGSWNFDNDQFKNFTFSTSRVAALLGYDAVEVRRKEEQGFDVILPEETYLVLLNRTAAVVVDPRKGKIT